MGRRADAGLDSFKAALGSIGSKRASISGATSVAGGSGGDGGSGVGVFLTSGSEGEEGSARLTEVAGGGGLTLLEVRVLVADRAGVMQTISIALRICLHPLSLPIRTPTKVGGGCSTTKRWQRLGATRV